MDPTAPKALSQHIGGIAVLVVAMGWDRFAILLLAIFGITVLAVMGKVDPAAVVGFYSLVVGFVFGRAPTMGADQRTNDDGGER